MRVRCFSTLVACLVVAGCVSAAAWGDTVRWGNGEVWNDAQVHALRVVDGVAQLDITHRGQRGWHRNVAAATFSAPIPPAARAEAIFIVQRWQPGAHRPSIKQILHDIHYKTAEGVNGVSADVWVAEPVSGSLPDELIFDVTAAVYDARDYSTEYAFAVDLSTRRVWHRNMAAMRIMQSTQEPAAPQAGVSPYNALPRPGAPAVAAPRPPQVDPPAGAASQSGALVGNRNSKTFHLATCSSARNMSQANVVPFATRQEAEAAGYQPCKRCKP